MMASMFASGIKIIILTGRMEANRNISSDWLRINNVKYDWLEMRKDDDFRPSEIFKAEYVEKFYKEEVLMIFDDLSRVIDHFKSLGYPTFKVEAKV